MKRLTHGTEADANQRKIDNLQINNIKNLASMSAAEFAAYKSEVFSAKTRAQKDELILNYLHSMSKIVKILWKR